ncbi:serine aminopeptidase domain-containing protein [Erythrobacter donghaensis]|uniref:alpha/beta hydrolase n=1 Tax=Erythrobacter donghaensis TaxID=267135 RepID=UPI00093F7A5A|nr:alpha/beta hydrolase [Erythrobacter donghaensis]
MTVETGSAQLAGTLSFPEDRPRAAVVLVQGAGPHARDQVISGAPMFKLLADGLAAQGIASVRVDNAGVGASTGERVQHFKQRIPQIRAVLDMLAARPELAGVPIGIIGHSEGTLVATEVWAEREGVIDFVVLLGAPGRQGRTVWIDQQANPARFPGSDQAKLTAIRATFADIADASIAGDHEAIGQGADRLFAMVGLSAQEIAEVRGDFVDRMASPEMQVFLAHDPAPVFARVTDPVLAVWGTHDDLTEPSLNAPIFLAKRHDAGALTLAVLPREDHFFLRGEGLAPGEHVAGKMELSSALVDLVAGWIKTGGLSQGATPR